MADIPREQQNAVYLIALERSRQIVEEGFTADHDYHHSSGQLAWAAVCYAAPLPIYRHEESYQGFWFHDPWPWDRDWDKRGKHSRLRELVIAGALIAAEIDRRLRLGESTEEEPIHRLRKT